MRSISEIIKDFEGGAKDSRLLEIYMDMSKISYQRARYIDALIAYADEFAGGDRSGEVEFYSAPGRSEIGGNHTDHQHGNVLCASVNVDAIAVAGNKNPDTVRVLSKGYDVMTISLDDLDKKIEEEGTTIALIKGVLFKIKENGHNIGGFDAYITSDVLSGSGLSSSAAFETIIATIISGLYNDMDIDAVEIAKIGQYAENVYFGKPCGLMDQMACSVGSLCHIDFIHPEEPKIEKIDFDLASVSYSLCITDTKGSHADLTPDYAAVPKEMKEVAACFNKEVLREVPEEDFMREINTVRTKCGDRAVLRALHFYGENRRAVEEAEALKKGDFYEFLRIFRLSGDSSYKYLQNVYTNHDVGHQNVSIGIAISDYVLKGRGVPRVHGGGFAGTMQAFVDDRAVAEYKTAMDRLYGEGACMVYKIRRFGGIKVI